MLLEIHVCRVVGQRGRGMNHEVEIALLEDLVLRKPLHKSGQFQQPTSLPADVYVLPHLQSFRFLDLAAETRNDILENLFFGSRLEEISKPQRPNPFKPEKYGVLLVSRQLYREASDSLYRSAVFHLKLGIASWGP